MDRLTPKDMADGITRSIPLQRDGTIDDVANMTVYLFSEAANWVSGQIIVSTLLSICIRCFLFGFELGGV